MKKLSKMSDAFLLKIAWNLREHQDNVFFKVLRGKYNFILVEDWDIKFKNQDSIL